MWVSVFLLGSGSSPINAQTAHSGATISVGSGYQLPTGVTVDKSGDVFVSNIGSLQAIREAVAVNGAVSPASQVVPIGTGFNNLSDIAIDANSNLFVVDISAHAVKEIRAVNGVLTANSQAFTIGSGFTNPSAVAVDFSGNVYVADGSEVKEIVAAKGAVSSTSQVITIGSGFSAPLGVAVDTKGDVFVADTGNATVKEILASNGTASSTSPVITIGSGFVSPAKVAVDGSGNVFVADSATNLVSKMVAVNGTVSSSSLVVPLGGGFNFPDGVAVDGSGNVFVADYNNNAVKEVLAGTQKFPTMPLQSTSAPLTIYFTFDSGGTLAGTPYVVLTQGALNLDFQAAATQDSDACITGHLYSAGDTCSVNVIFTPTEPYQRMGAVQLMGSSGPIATFNLRGTGTGPQVIFPTNSTLKMKSGFDGPCGVAIDGSGNAFVADTGNSEVKQIVAVNGVVSSTSIVNTVGSGFQNPTGVAADASGNVFVADTGNSEVKEIVAVNGVVSSASVVNTVGSGFRGPTGVAVDASGNVFVADAGNSEVKEIVATNGVASSTSVVNTLGGGFKLPSSVAVDGRGDVFVADIGNNTVNVVAISPPGVLRIAGLSSEIPVGVAVDARGSLLIADAGNNSVDGVNFSAAPSLDFATTMVGSVSSDSPKSVEFENIGNEALVAAAPVLVIGPNFTQEALGPCTATFTLNPGESCTLYIGFTPHTAGSPLTSTATFTDNALNASPFASQIVNLAGVATTEPAVINFRTLPTYAYGQTFQATATSNLPSPIIYSLVSGPARVTPAGEVTITGVGAVTLQASQAAHIQYGGGSATATFNAAKAQSSTSLSVSGKLTFTAVVAPEFGGTPTGVVTFYLGSKEVPHRGAPLPVALSTQALVRGTASYTLTQEVLDQYPNLAHEVHASYTGDTNFSGSDSKSIAFTTSQ
jgi:DNA-binding beta-propeller fold protein YncE